MVTVFFLLFEAYVAFRVCCVWLDNRIGYIHQIDYGEGIFLKKKSKFFVSQSVWVLTVLTVIYGLYWGWSAIFSLDKFNYLFCAGGCLLVVMTLLLSYVWIAEIFFKKLWKPCISKREFYMDWYEEFHCYKESCFHETELLIEFKVDFSLFLRFASSLPVNSVGRHFLKKYPTCSNARW